MLLCEFLGGVAHPTHKIETTLGKVPLMPDYYIVDKNEKEYTLRNDERQLTSLPNIRK